MSEEKSEKQRELPTENEVAEKDDRFQLPPDSVSSSGAQDGQDGQDGQDVKLDGNIEGEIVATQGFPPNFVPLSEGEIDDLDAFCAQVDLEDCDFGDFLNVHHRLDLTVPLVVSPEELSVAGSKELKFTRTVKKVTNSGIKVSKEKVTVSVSWSHNAVYGEVIRMEGWGDSDENNLSGALLVTLSKPIP